MSVNSKVKADRVRSAGISFAKALLIVGWVVVAFIAGGILTLVLDSVLNLVGLPLSGLSDSVEVAVRAAMMYGSATLVAIGVPLLVRRGKADKSVLGLNRLPEWSDILLGPIAYIPYIILSLSLVWVATIILPGFDVREAQETGFQTITNQIGYSMAFFTLVVIAPVAEEILFRGYLYGKLKRHIGLVGAIILTSLCFAALHLQLNVAVDVFALSIVLCLLREFTGSIWAGILLHMTKNFIAFYFLFIMPLGL